MSNDTPRTYKVLFDLALVVADTDKCIDYRTERLAEHARDLERALSAAQEQLEGLREANKKLSFFGGQCANCGFEYRAIAGHLIPCPNCALAKAQEQLREARDRTELGCAGHFILARDCHWRRHTQVGNYRVSSVGDLYYQSEPDKRQTVGATGYFETLVFKLTDRPAADNDGCGCREVAEWSEIDGRRYDTAGEAQAGHEHYVVKYAARKEKTMCPHGSDR